MYLLSVAGGIRVGKSRWRVTRPRGQLEPSQELNLIGSHLLMLSGNRLGSRIELFPQGLPTEAFTVGCFIIYFKMFLMF